MGKTIAYYEGKFDENTGKFLNSLVKYKKINGIFQSNPSKSLIKFSIEKRIPIFKNIKEIKHYASKVVLTNLSFKNNKISNEILELIKFCSRNKIKLYNGTHVFIKNKIKRNDYLYDLRNIGENQNLFKGSILKIKNQKRILSVGADCNIGKMTFSLELEKELKKLKKDVKLIPTGQIGIFLKGYGVPLDRTIVDFTSGVMENYTLKFKNEIIIIEGQGSIFSPLYSGLALAQLHGCAPDSMILCIDLRRRNPRYVKNVKLPSIQKMIEMYEKMAKIVNKKSKIIGMSVNTSYLKEKDAIKVIKK